MTKNLAKKKSSVPKEKVHTQIHLRKTENEFSLALLRTLNFRCLSQRRFPALIVTTEAY